MSGKGLFKEMYWHVFFVVIEWGGHTYRFTGDLQSFKELHIQLELKVKQHKMKRVIERSKFYWLEVDWENY